MYGMGKRAESSRAESKETYLKSWGRNRYDILDDYEVNFPVLGNGLPKTINNDEVLNQRLTQKKYSQITKPQRNRMQSTTASTSKTTAPRSPKTYTPVYNSSVWSKTSEVEKLMAILCEKFQINKEDPTVKLIENLCKNSANERLLIKPANKNVESKNTAT